MESSKQPVSTDDVAGFSSDNSVHDEAARNKSPQGDGPLISVVIPTLNRAEMVAAGVRSVWESVEASGKPPHLLEVIVIDNGSTDGTPEKLEAEFGERVRLLQCEKRGLGAPRNVGIEAARGEYIAFLDDDDLWLPWTFENYHRLIVAKAPGFVASSSLRFYEEAEIEPKLDGFRTKELQVRGFPDYFSAVDEVAFIASSSQAMARREAILRVGGMFEEDFLNEDLDLWIRLGAEPDFWWFEAPPQIAYRLRKQNTTTRYESAYRGLMYMWDFERAGKYPGGAARQEERRRLLGRLSRPRVFSLLESGYRREAWRLYWRLLSQNFSEGRWRFLAGFPAMALMAAVGLKPRYPRRSD